MCWLRQHCRTQGYAPIVSNKRDDHRDQEAESISTRSMRVPSSKSRIPASGKVVRLLIVETVTAQGSAFAS